MYSNKEKNNLLTRRNFIKASTAVGASTAIAGVSVAKNPKKGTAYAASLITKQHDEFPIEISSEYKRFSDRNICQHRALSGDPAVKEGFMNFIKKFQGIIPPSGEPGFSEIDLALANAAWSIEMEYGSHNMTGVKKTKYYMLGWEGAINERKTTFSSLEDATEKVKKAAKFLGADLVGIAKYEDVEKFVYSDWFDSMEQKEIPGEFPFKPKSVISLAYEMDYEGFMNTPYQISNAAVGDKYSAMAVTSHKIAVFLRRLGYQAIPCGNDTALSIPIAIQAGLGELSRMGLLVTKKYGPRVRLSKVFTDLELVPDKPITFGVQEFCKVCMKCVDNCPSGAVPKDPEPSYNLPTISNIPEVKKWCIDPEKCLNYWGEVGGGCGCCIAVCPYNKIEEWHHDLAKLATVTPGVRNAARYFDELFGYGKIYNESAVDDFWTYKED